MTYGELYKEVVHLGFDLELESELTFNMIEAINRALRTVNALRPRESIVSFPHLSVMPELYAPSLVILREAHTVTPSFPFRSLWFQAAGEGRVRVMAKNGSTIIEREWKATHGFVDVSIAAEGEGASVSFLPSGAACIREICVYAFPYEGAVPGYAAHRSYNLSTLTKGDYVMIVGRPWLDGSGELTSYELHGATLRLPTEPSGVVSVRYRAAVPRITGDNDAEIIPLDDDLSHLVAPLAASWLYLEIDEAKALLYRQRFESEATLVDRSYRRPAHFEDLTNWG